MGLLRNIADKLKGKKQEAIEIDYNPQEEPEGLRRDDVDMHDKKQRRHVWNKWRKLPRNWRRLAVSTIW